MASTPEERLKLDTETLYAMGSIFCKANHGEVERDDQGLCTECREVIDYSLYRTSVCPHQHKGNCKECTIHCYKPEMRQGIRNIMRYAAPRMTYLHPVLCGRYLGRKITGRIALKREARQKQKA